MSRSLEEIKDNMSCDIDDSVGLASVMYKFDTDDYTCVSVFVGDAIGMDDEIFITFRIERLTHCIRCKIRVI